MRSEHGLSPSQSRFILCRGRNCPSRTASYGSIAGARSTFCTTSSLSRKSLLKRRFDSLDRTRQRRSGPMPWLNITRASKGQPKSASRSCCAAPIAPHQDPRRALTPYRLKASPATGLNEDHPQNLIRHHQGLAQEGNDVLGHASMASSSEVNSRRNPTIGERHAR